MMMGLKKFVTYDSSEQSRLVGHFNFIAAAYYDDTAAYFVIKPYNPF